jgi:hypothetical protein
VSLVRWSASGETRRSALCLVPAAPGPAFGKNLAAPDAVYRGRGTVSTIGEVGRPCRWLASDSAVERQSRRGPVPVRSKCRSTTDQDVPPCPPRRGGPGSRLPAGKPAQSARLAPLAQQSCGRRAGPRASIPRQFITQQAIVCPAAARLLAGTAAKVNRWNSSCHLLHFRHMIGSLTVLQSAGAGQLLQSWCTRRSAAGCGRMAAADERPCAPDAGRTVRFIERPFCEVYRRAV